MKLCVASIAVFAVIVPSLAFAQAGSIDMPSISPTPPRPATSVPPVVPNPNPSGPTVVRQAAPDQLTISKAEIMEITALCSSRADWRNFSVCARMRPYSLSNPGPR